VTNPPNFRKSKSASARIDFDAVNATALAVLPSLLSRWLGCCPAHDDRMPNLSVTVDKGVRHDR
jgi:hypothetical protein